MTSIEVVDANIERRNKVMKQLKEKLIDSWPVFSPMSTLPMYERNGDNPIAYRIGHSSINLPSGHNLTSDQIDYI